MTKIGILLKVCKIIKGVDQCGGQFSSDILVIFFVKTY